MSGLIGGLALGAASAGAAAIAARRQQKQQESQMAAARSDMQMQMMAQAGQANMEAMRMQHEGALRKQQFDMEAESRRALASKLTGAPADTKKLGLGATFTSPLGDLSEANIGRKRLLG